MSDMKTKEETLKRPPMAMYVIYDEVGKESGNIGLFKNEETAMRWFARSVPKDLAADFNLYLLGTYDIDTMNGDFLSMPSMVNTNHIKRALQEEVKANGE